MCMGGAPSAPPVAAPIATPAVPTQVDPSVLAARQNIRNQAAQSRGRASTILTASGVATDIGLQPSTPQGKTLLGA